MNVGKLAPQHLSALRRVRQYVETGTFGADAVNLTSADMCRNFEPIRHLTLLQSEALRLAKLDGSTADGELAAGLVQTRDGRRLEIEGKQLTLCVPEEDRTTYLVSRHEPGFERSATVVLRHPGGAGGPQASFYAATGRAATGELSGQMVHWVDG